MEVTSSIEDCSSLGVSSVTEVSFEVSGAGVSVIGVDVVGAGVLTGVGTGVGVGVGAGAGVGAGFSGSTGVVGSLMTSPAGSLILPSHSSPAVSLGLSTSSA